MTEASLIYRMLESSFTLFTLFLFFSIALGRLKIAVLTGCVRTQITPTHDKILEIVHESLYLLSTKTFMFVVSRALPGSASMYL